ncbi:MAG TPA: isoaspartyl peptidase/L-asparaginase [Myxococcota bacterium]|nr:isoaspartyl peptidase/L-asparaginase [Myxococcota bacterium]
MRSEHSAAGVALAIHGGAGRIVRERVRSSRDRALRDVVAEILREGLARLEAGGSALDAAQLAVARLEDDPQFNAGRGSALTAAGDVEMDAALMDGRTRAAGAVACVRGVRNPIALARAVLDDGRHVLLAGEGAERFARECGIALASRAWLVTRERERELASARASGRVSLDRDEPGALGTVGAVARDASGHLAAATSTGGMTNQLPGRIGDSPILGAGTWADDASCAVSATGHGESFLRAAFAHEVDAAMRLAALPLRPACEAALARIAALGGSGGCIALAGSGDAVAVFDTPGMVRGWISKGSRPFVALYADEA